MDAKLIEKLDRQRYRAAVSSAVGLVGILLTDALEFSIFSWGKVPFEEMIMSNTYGEFVFWSCFFTTSALLIAGAIWYVVIECRIARNKELRAALNNEMYVANRRRAQHIALWVVMCALLVCGIFDMLKIFHTPTGVIFDLGLATVLTSWLILNRNRG